MAAKSAPIPGPPGIQATLPEHGLIAVAWAGVAVAGAFLAARTAVRISIIGRLGGDDYWLYFGFLVFLVNAVLQTLQTPSVYFVSRLIRNLESDPVEIGKQGNIYVRYEFAIIGFFWTVLWCVKASFLSLYYNLFQGLGAGQRRIWWFVAVFTGLAYAGCWIASILVCIPAYTYFEFGKCSNPTGSAIAIIYSTGVDVLTDIMSKSIGPICEPVVVF